MYFSICSTYLSLAKSEQTNSYALVIYIEFIYVSALLFILWLVFYSIEFCEKKVIKNDNWKYRESVLPTVRVLWKIVLGPVLLLLLLVMIPYQNTLQSNSKFLSIGLAVFSICITYQLASQVPRLGIFLTPKEFHLRRTLSFLGIPLFLLFNLPNNEMLLSVFTTWIKDPFITSVISIVSFLITCLSFSGISLNREDEFNNNLRSLISAPIAIRTIDGTSLDKTQIYNSVVAYFPKSRVYIEKTSVGFRENKAEIIVIDWQEYSLSEIDLMRKNFNIKMIDVLTKCYKSSKNPQGLKVLNFTVDRDVEGNIVNIYPVQNKCFLNILKGIENFRFKLKDVKLHRLLKFYKKPVP